MNESHSTSVLFVCMGNICRSPTAEGVLRHLARREAPELRLVIDSAGTHGYHIGEPPDPRSQAAALRRQIDLSPLRARLFERADFDRFDLVLPMDEDNRRRVLALSPPDAANRVRLFLDFARGQPLREVPDPYYGETGAFEQVLDLVELASRGLLEHLQGHRAAPPQAARSV